MYSKVCDRSICLYVYIYVHVCMLRCAHVLLFYINGTILSFYPWGSKHANLEPLPQTQSFWADTCTSAHTHNTHILSNTWMWNMVNILNFSMVLKWFSPVISCRHPHSVNNNWHSCQMTRSSCSDINQNHGQQHSSSCPVPSRSKRFHLSNNPTPISAFLKKTKKQKKTKNLHLYVQGFFKFRRTESWQILKS